MIGAAATRREVELQLSEAELLSPGTVGQAAWISDGLKLEDAQSVIGPVCRGIQD